MSKRYECCQHCLNGSARCDGVHPFPCEHPGCAAGNKVRT